MLLSKLPVNEPVDNWMAVALLQKDFAGVGGGRQNFLQVCRLRHHECWSFPVLCK